MLIKTSMLLCVWGGASAEMTLNSRRRLICRGGFATELAWADIGTVGGRTGNLLASFSLSRSIPLAANEPGEYVIFTFKVAVASSSSASG